MKRRYFIHYISIDRDFEGYVVANTPKPIRTHRDIERIETELNEDRTDKIIVISYTQMHK